jgi:3D (Asp-Asp-Asp) domain-containing protein
VLELYAAETSLARARNELAHLEQRSSSLARLERDTQRQARVVRRSLAASQERVAVLLRALYLQGEPDPISVILGATSLDEAVAGIEGLSHATAANERLGIEAELRARRLERLRERLGARRKNLNDARSASRVGADRLATAVAASRETVESLRRQRALTSQRLSELQVQAEDAQRRAADITAIAEAERDRVEEPTAAAPSAPETTPETASPAAAPAPGTRTLVADAVAYHLQGSTASGLPVGVGVIAVDPAVIPLGTRVFIPGYGPAVAADVGSAIKGNIIDLWMPSTAQARAWGRRTVTITVYG